MSFLLPKLTNKSEVDEAIKSTEDVVLVLRFGRDDDNVCMQLDHIVSMLFKCHWFSRHYFQFHFHFINFRSAFISVHSGPYNYQKALYTGKHFYLPKSTEYVCSVDYYFMCVG